MLFPADLFKTARMKIYFTISESMKGSPLFKMQLHKGFDYIVTNQCVVHIHKLLVFSDKLNKLCDLTVINYIPGSIHIRFVIWQCSLITSGRASGRVIEVCLLVHDIEQVERHTYTKNKKKTRLSQTNKKLISRACQLSAVT